MALKVKNKFSIINLVIVLMAVILAVFILFIYLTLPPFIETAVTVIWLTLLSVTLILTPIGLFKERKTRGKKWWVAFLGLIVLVLLLIFLVAVYDMAWVISSHARP